MAGILLLGLGGFGRRVLENVVSDMKKNNIHMNNGEFGCLSIDFNDYEARSSAASALNIPSISLGSDKCVKDYVHMYSEKNVLDWYPESPRTLMSNMRDGGGLMRTNARLAFMDAVENGSLNTLEQLIESMIVRNDQNAFRVIVVTSLFGSLGSGIFIQTALWLRKCFKQKGCMATIKGVFVLPDVFAGCYESLRNDRRMIDDFNANAYASLLELEAITKAKKMPMSLPFQLRLDGLFDSGKDQPDGLSVYDYVYLIDDMNERGMRFADIREYEQFISRFVSMQISAPMYDNLFSEDDVLLRRFLYSEDTKFGSFGNAKAVYPTEDIFRYCALRAARDSLARGWNVIDDQIASKLRHERELEGNGVLPLPPIDARKEYVRIFNEKTDRSKGIGDIDKFFLGIADDVKNVASIKTVEGTPLVIVSYTDKVDDFFRKLDEMIDKCIYSSAIGEQLQSLKLKKSWIDRSCDTELSLVSFVEKMRQQIKSFIDDAESAAEGFADGILERICCLNIDEVNKNDESTVLGFLTKRNASGEAVFVHPIAVRYLLYKLSSKLQDALEEIDPLLARDDAIKGYGNGIRRIMFDNPATRSIEDDAIEYLNSRRIFQNKDKFIRRFKEIYAERNEGQIKLCEYFAFVSVKYQLAKLLHQRIDSLISIVEDFFSELPGISDAIDRCLSENIKKNEQSARSIVYVYASGEEKDHIFKSLNICGEKADAKANEEAIWSIYSVFCARSMPWIESNAANNKKNTNDTFFKELVSAYNDVITAENRELIDLDIISAICKSEDLRYEKENSADNTEINNPYQRYEKAISDTVQRLTNLSSVLMRVNGERELEPLFNPSLMKKITWGFNPVLAQNYPGLGTFLGVNFDNNQNGDYPKNELICSKTLYGFSLNDMEKFNENGSYFRSYSCSVESMNKGIAEGDRRQLVYTPHLDKTWHAILPFFVPKDQNSEDEYFRRLLSLAADEGLFDLDRGIWRVMRLKASREGNCPVYEEVKYKDETLKKENVLELLMALREDKEFLADAAELERKACRKTDIPQETDPDLKNQTFDENNSRFFKDLSLRLDKSLRSEDDREFTEK